MNGKEKKKGKSANLQIFVSAVHASEQRMKKYSIIKQ